MNIKVPVIALLSLYHGKEIDAVTASFEMDFNNVFPQKSTFVDINGLLHRILLQREEWSSFIEQWDGI